MTNDAVTTSALAILAAEVKDDVDLDAFVNGLATAEVPIAVLRVREVRRRLQDIEGRLETRLVADQVTSWTDPATGDEYDVRGDGRWEYRDPQGLMAALREAGLADKDIQAALQPDIKVSTVELNRLCSIFPSIQSVVDDFRVRKYGPRHLTKRDKR